VYPTTIHKWTTRGILRPVSGPQIDGAEWNLYLRREVEKLHDERERFKKKRIKAGGTPGFGMPAGPNRQPVRSTVEPRINELVKHWTTRHQGQRISGQRLHLQLLKEGYRVGINTIYVCLRELRQQSSPH
jgi:hypothetical protein